MATTPTGIVRIVGADNSTAGTGFLVGVEGLIATCTHVVDEARAPDGSVALVFHRPGETGDGEVMRAVPDEPLTRAANAEDLALLRLEDPLPAAVAPVPLGSSERSLGGTFHTFGFPTVKPVEGMAGELSVTGRTSEGGFPVLQLRSDEITLGFSGAPAWDDATGAVVGVVVSVVSPDADPAWRGGTISFLRPVELLIAICPALRPSDVCPYRGLEVFEADHAGIYFGREAATALLLKRLADQDLVAVVGVSGSGKSSLVRAGLEKGLGESSGPGLAGRPRAAFKPGAAPALDLALALVATAGLSDLAGSPFTMPGKSQTARRKLERRLQRVPADELGAAVRHVARNGLILIADQFERLFTDCRDDSVRRSFIDTLLAAASYDVKVLLTLRADFYGLALGHPGLAREMERSQLTLLPMEKQELLRAIEGPAESVGRSFEPGLPERIAADVSGSAGDLPLLEFALTELWERDAAEGVLRATTYDALGYAAPGGERFPGMQGAIARRAEEVWTTLTDDERVAARRVFLALVSAGPDGEAEAPLAVDASRRAWQAELDEASAAVAQKLADARLLTTATDPLTGNPTVEVAHEALIRAWPRLQNWLREYRPFIRLRDRDLIPFWQRWEQNERNDEFLLPAPMLEEARYWLGKYPDDLGPVAGYVRASIDAAAEAEARRQKEVVRLRDLRRRAQEERHRAVSRGLAGQALANLDRRLDLAALLALEAWRVAPTIEARSVALATLQRTEDIDAILRLPNNSEVSAVAFSPDGRTLASGGYDRAITLWDVGTRRPRGEPLRGARSEDDEVSTLVFSPDGNVLASVHNDGGVVLWALGGRMPRGSELPLTEALGGAVNTLAFSPDGRLLVTTAYDTTLTVWPLAGKEQPVKLGEPGGFASSDACFLGDGRTIASVAQDGGLRLWDLATRKKTGRMVRVQDGEVRGAVFTADGSRVAAIALDGSVSVWDVTSRRALSKLPDAHAEAAAFSRDGTQVALVSQAGSVSVWDADTGGRVAGPFQAMDDAVSLSVDPDAGMVAAGGTGSVTLWSLAPDAGLSATWREEGKWAARVAFTSAGVLAFSGPSFELIGEGGKNLRTLEAPGRIVKLAASPDGLTLFGLADGGLHCWDVQSGRREGPFEPGLGAVTLAVAPDGATVALAGYDGMTALWNVHEQTPHGSPVAGDASIVWDVEFSPDGRTLMAAGYGQVIRIWHVVEGEHGRLRLELGDEPLRGHTGAVNCLTVGPDGKLLASGGLDGTVRLWDLSARQAVGEPMAAETRVSGVAFSPDGRILASSGQNGSVRLWDVETRRLLGEPLPAHGEAAHGVAFNPDGRSLATSGERPGLRVWNSLLWTNDRRAVHRRLCAVVSRNLTAAEWAEFLPDEKYRPTCGD